MTQALPLRTKLLYATSSVGGEALSQSRALWLLYFYAPPADADLPTLLPRALIGVLLTVGKIVEAFDDALIGYWSDRTKSRWGRRIPFILGATPLWALFAFLLFAPPEDAGRATTALYFFVVIELFFLFSTISGGPYESLLPEIAPTSDERLKVAGIRVYFGVAGGAVGLIVSDVLVDAVGFRGMAVVLAALALTCRYVGLAGVWSRAKLSRQTAEIGFRDAMRATFRNRAFLSFLPSFILFQIAFQMLLGMLPFYVDAIFPDGWVRVRYLTAAAIGTAVVAVPVFVLLARRTSKRQAYRVAMIGSACTFPLLFFAGFVPGIPKEAQIFFLIAIAGAPIAGNYLFPATLTADIIDQDSADTGQRREATYYGAQNFVEKVSTSLAPLFLTLLLLLGDSSSNPLGIRLVGPAAGIVVLCGYLVFRSYDLADDVEGRVEPEPGKAA